MEYKISSYVIPPLLAFMAWVVHYWYLAKKSEILIPRRYIITSGMIKKIIIFIIGVTGWFLLTVAFLAPKSIKGGIPHEIEANDIYFVIDVSRSMEAIDFSPNRLEAAKKMVKDFVAMVPQDRIGLIIFSEKAFTLLPLTTDINIIYKALEDIKTRKLGSGTNIGDSLGLAVGRLSFSLAKSRIIILLTDGVSNVGSMTPIEAASEAEKEKIKIYTIGIGSDSKNVMLPVDGGRYERIPGGSIDFDVLKEISKMTSAKSYSANNQESLKNVFTTIANLETSKVEANTSIAYEEEYLKFLIWGILIIYLAEIFRRVILREII